MRRAAKRLPTQAPLPSTPAAQSQGWAHWLLFLVTASLIVLLVSHEIYDFDFWQHLAVGRAIWTTHRVPTTQVWTWPHYGEPDVNSSWGFEALFYPFYAVAGLGGLFAWRWVTALLATGLALLTARRLGASAGVAAITCVTAVVAARARWLPRPETLSTVLFGLYLFLLERRRQGGTDRTPFLVGLAWIWANCHISYFLGLLLIALFGLEAAWRSRRDPTARPLRLWAVLAGAVVASFLNPFGWRALWQPFDFALEGMRQPILRSIDELHPLRVGAMWRELVPILIGVWPVLYLWRARKGRVDLVEGTLLLGLTVMSLRSMRFLIYLAMVIAPYLARTISEILASLPPSWRAWGAGRRAPALATILAVGVALPSLTEPVLPLRMTIARDVQFPGACDFIERHDVRGRMFNPFHVGGYVLWRFWPERLPFSDIHQTGTFADMNTYLFALYQRSWWRRLDRKFAFDHALLDRHPTSDSLMSFLERDSAWALVFADDEAVLYLRRDTHFDTLIARTAYRELRMSPTGINRTGGRAEADGAYRGRVRRELERMAEASSSNASAHSLLANLAMYDKRWDDARRELAMAKRREPGLSRYHERLGIVALFTGKAREALREFEEQRRLEPGKETVEARMGDAYLALGDTAHAILQYRKELAAHPRNPVALQGLGALKHR